MSEQINDSEVEQTNTGVGVQSVAGSTASTDNTEAVLAKLKELVVAAGAQAHAVFDDLIELAKKLV